MTFERRWVSPLTKVRIEDGCFQASELLAKRKTKKSSAHVEFLLKLRHGEVMKRFVRFTYRRRDKSLRNVNLRTEKTLWQHQHTVCSLDKQRRGASGVDSMFQNIFFPDSVLCDDFCVGDRKSLTFQERWYWKWNWASVKRLASLQRLLTRTKLPCVQTQYSSIRKQEREREREEKRKESCGWEVNTARHLFILSFWAFNELFGMCLCGEFQIRVSVAECLFCGCNMIIHVQVLKKGLIWITSKL